VLKDRLANDVRRNGTHSSGTDDDRVLRALAQTLGVHLTLQASAQLCVNWSLAVTDDPCDPYKMVTHLTHDPFPSSGLTI